MDPVHPGEVLLEDLMEPLGITHADLAKRLSIDESILRGVTDGILAVTPELDSALAEKFGMSEGIWLEMQQDYNNRRRT